ncbi:MAG: hypothetical protein NE327_21835 [Lentisphaeraceae bacterium]|nr:hypothetical protein [Lentisphaeraceae bacterium]
MDKMLKDIFKLKAEIDTKINFILERDLSLLTIEDRSVGLWFMTFGFDRCYEETKEQLFDLDTSRREVDKLICKMRSKK